MTSRHSLNIAVVGAGLMGCWHAHFASRAGARIVAIVDPNLDAARRLQRSYPRARVCAALDAALGGGPVDAVHICAPTAHHCSSADVALAHRKHVLVEKPMASSASETERLISAARANGVLICPVHQLPFQRGFQMLRANRDRLGDVARATFTCFTAGGRDLTPAARQTLLLEILPHPVSLFYSLFGEEVLGALSVVAAEGADELEIGGTLQGMRVTAIVSVRGRPTELSLRVVGTRGTSHADLFHGFSYTEAGDVSRRAKLTRPLTAGAALLAVSGANLVRRALASERAYPGLQLLITRFYESIRRGGPPPVHEREAIGSARLIDRIGAELRAPQSVAGVR